MGAAAEEAPVDTFDAAAFRALAVVQDGVISRRQLRELGALPHDVRRMLRRRELVVVHPGVYVEHTGPLTWAQRAWVAVLACWPAALTGESALPDPDENGAIHVAVAVRRTVQRPPGVVVHRTAGLDDRVRWNASPPRLRVEHAVIEVLRRRLDPVARFRLLADVVQSRATTAEQIAAVLRARHGIPDRVLLLDLIEDLASGACSVLEREYLRLERTHGLPSPDRGTGRQTPFTSNGRRGYRDVLYVEQGVAVELDGRAFHDTAAARDRDADRDLDLLLSDGGVTLRLTYSQVFTDGCRTIAKVAVLLQRRGWTGEPLRCADCPRS